jgi:hypothetical protein
MVIYPNVGFGVVIVTNCDFTHPFIHFDIAHSILGGQFDSIKRAVNLEFNYK